jgi:hypothetical protein
VPEYRFAGVLQAIATWSAVVVVASSCTGSSSGPQSFRCQKESPIETVRVSADSSSGKQNPKANVLIASSANGSAAGLLFLRHKLPITSGDEVKIVWRVTGSGPLSIQYFDPSGREQVLTFGPKEHLGSSFDRPGDEWGAGFRFAKRGCWRIRLSRTGTSADAWVSVG